MGGPRPVAAAGWGEPSPASRGGASRPRRAVVGRAVPGEPWWGEAMKMARRWLCRARARRWRSGRGRADMRPETRDLPGRHETLRLPVGGPQFTATVGRDGVPSPSAMGGPRPVAAAKISLSHVFNRLTVSLSQCLRKSQVSGLWSPPPSPSLTLPHPSLTLPPTRAQNFNLPKTRLVLGRGDVVSYKPNDMPSRADSALGGASPPGEPLGRKEKETI